MPAVAFGEKKIETRTWETKYRGLLAIHAAAKIPPGWLGASRYEGDFKAAVKQVHARQKWGPFGWPVAGLRGRRATEAKGHAEHTAREAIHLAPAFPAGSKVSTSRLSRLK